MLPIFLIGIAGLILAGINIVNKPAKPNLIKDTKSALNTQLPPPDLPVKQKNKLETYMEAAQDSARKQAEWKRDPNSKQFNDPAPLTVNRSSKNTPEKHSRTSATSVREQDGMDSNERKVNERLQKLYEALNQSKKVAKTDTPPSLSPICQAGPITLPSTETERLEKLLLEARRPDTVGDPNMDRIEKMLDKVLDIQHPERLTVPAQGDQSATLQTVYPVTTRSNDPTQADNQDITTDDSGPNGFYGLEQENQVDSLTKVTTIQAVVPEDQTLQNGSTIKLRLMQDIYVGSHRIPANNFIYGTCTVNNQRLQVQLTAAIDNNEIFPISLKVYDLDGLEGIFVPGAVTRDVTKEGISQGINGMGIMSLDPSLGAQAAAAGIQTAKALLSRKVKAVIVTVRAGHRVLLQPARAGR